MWCLKSVGPEQGYVTGLPGLHTLSVTVMQKSVARANRSSWTPYAVSYGYVTCEVCRPEQTGLPGLHTLSVTEQCVKSPHVEQSEQVLPRHVPTIQRPVPHQLFANMGAQR